MLKVIIIDDEPRICNMIKRLISWDELDLEFVGSVGNGLEAEKMIGDLHPDIAIVDIQIPGITGLELIERFYKKPSAPRFIVISGYKEFEYAQKAIRFGIENYLLKPISKGELNQTLGEIIDRNKAQSNEKLKHNNLVEELSVKNQLIRKNEIRSLLSNPEHQLIRNAFRFDDGLFSLVLLHLHFRDIGVITDNLSISLLSQVGKRITQNSPGDMWDAEFYVIDSFCYVLFNYLPDSNDFLRERLTYVQNSINEFNVCYDQTIMTGAVTEPVFKNSFGKAISEVRSLVNMRIVIDGRRIIDESRASLCSDNNNPLFSRESISKIVNHVIGCDVSGMTKEIRQVFETVEKTRKDSAFKLYDEIKKLICLLQEHIIENNPDSEDILLGLADENSDFFRKIDNCDTFDQLRALTEDAIQNIIGVFKQIKEETDNEPIRIVKKYVQDNLNRQVFLEDIAPLAYVSADYLGKLFKQKTGVSFSNYVIQTRMETARKLLENRRYSVAEIAEKVGYADSRHFSKAFTKLYGVNPASYRKLFC